MDTQLRPANANMTMEAFKNTLGKISALEALQNFKNLLDRSLGVGLFKNTEDVIVMYTSLDILYNKVGFETESAPVTNE